MNDIANRLFAAIERGDGPGLAALWSEDIVVWRQGGGRERDKARGLKVIEYVDRLPDELAAEVDASTSDGAIRSS